MATQFGPMHSSQDGIDRVEVRVPVRLSRDDIVKIVAVSFGVGHKPTKAEIYEQVIRYLAMHGTAGLLGNGMPGTVSLSPDNWEKRLAWANEYISRIFSGWTQ